MPERDDEEKFKPRNRKKIEERDLKKLAPQQRSKYLAYEDPPKEVAEQQANAAKRLLELKKKHQKFPTSRDEINAIKHKFYNTCRIPNVVGAVDGTLIPIIAPAEHEEAYVCRKGFHALNVQAVCDADMRIRDVVAMWPGSQHDAGIFNNCGLKAHLEQNDIGILLGDSGYALKKYLLTSKLRPATEQEERYNTFHSRGRMVVERCFGLLKSRFRDNAPPSEEEMQEKDKHAKLIGQLKAAEARNRLRIMRLRYQSSRAQEISHLIACQPTALKAVRLQALVPSYPDTKDRGDSLDKLDRERVENLLEDSQGLLVNRIH